MIELADLDTAQTVELADQPTAESQPAPKARYGINAANARMMAAKSHEARRQARLAPPEQSQPLQPNPQTVDFTGMPLARAQCQYAALSVILDAELAKGAKADPKAIRELADALGKVGEHCRIRAGIPTPGSRRPRETREPRGRTWMTNAPPAEADPGEPNG